MRISDFDSARTLMDELRSLDQKIKEVEGIGLAVAIQGRYHDDLAKAMKPHVLAILQDKRDSILLELGKLGVTAL